MTVKRVVVDTNVLISYTLKPDGVVGKVVDHLLENSVLLFCQATFIEFETRLWRPKFDRYITLEQRKRVLHDLEAAAIWVEISGAAKYSRDPDDDKFVELALLGQAEVLISGDNDLLDLAEIEGLSILSPRGYWERYRLS